MTLPEILTDVEEYIQYLKEEGSNVAEVSRDVVDGITKRAATPPVENSVTAKRDETKPLKNNFADIVSEIAACKKCGLHVDRINTVPGQGNLTPEIMFIGEAPGADEDKQGLPFVGRAGKLLTKMIVAMGLTRDDVFIANILKCRPPENRRPKPDEMETCIPYLKRQIAVLKPKVIIALGTTAVHGLIESDATISELRGKWTTFEGIKLMPTFHPAYLLRSPSAKKLVWEDLQEVLRSIGKTPPTGE